MDFSATKVQAPPDDLEMVVQQIRELIQQLLQQAEQPRADATGSMRSAISADAEMPAPKIQISSPKDSELRSLKRKPPDELTVSVDLPVDSLFSLPHAPLVVPLEPPPELSPPETPKVSAPPAEPQPPQVERSQTEKSLKSQRSNRSGGSRVSRVSRDGLDTKRRVSTGGLQVVEDLRRPQRSGTRNSKGSKALSVSECSEAPRFGLRDGWDTLNGSFFVKSPRAFYTFESAGETNPWVRFDRFRQIWAVIAVCLIFRDCAFVPFMIFGTDSSFWMVEIFAACFWIANIPISWWIASRSKTTLRSLFWAQTCVDVLLIAPTVIDLFFAGQPYAGQVVLRGLQLGRLLQVPHWYNITGLSGRVREWLRFRSREFRAFWNLTWIFLIGALMLHVLTCLWFYVGVVNVDGWVREIKLDQERSWLNQYIKSFEWAVSRLPPSHLPENMNLRTRTERWLAMGATGGMMLFGAMFTSIVTNDLSDIRRVRRTQKEAQFQVADFFVNFSVTLELQDKVLGYLRKSVAKVHKPGKNDIKAFLPEYLFGELCREAFSPTVKSHRLFQVISHRHQGFQYDLCTRCLVDWYVVPGEVLFHAGPACDSMLFVVHGSIRYKKLTDAADLEDEASEEPRLRQNFSVIPDNFGAPAGTLCGSGERLAVGDWICEPCLWTSWTYCGKAVAGSKGGTLLALKPERLLETVAGHKEAATEMAIYAHMVVKELNTIVDEDLSDTLCFDLDLQ